MGGETGEGWRYGTIVTYALGSSAFGDAPQHIKHPLGRISIDGLFADGGVFDEVGGQFLEEARGMAGHELAVFFPSGAMADDQFLHGARDGDVKQAAFLVQRAFGG